MARRQNIRGKILQFMLVLVPLVVFVTFVLQKYSSPFQDVKDDMRRALFKSSSTSTQTSKGPSKAGTCVMKTDCAADHFSFFIQSGAANVVAPKICFQNKLLLGTIKNNAGPGINIVIVNGKTGEVIKTAFFNMYNGDVKPLIALLKGVETGSVVLMASYDDPATKLSEDARKLITEFGSSNVKSLGFRDNWVFVGGKGAGVKSNFEKYLKNDGKNNKYESWPELVELQGCIPKYVE
ncbi:protein FAM3C-like [Centropristis striata]|uniref:protein FAM3C-like n=1 Tax=Centropristis striata TaxID=184440 RepID=UPI0027E0FFFF|nr:protein FAM3C-like [Centropristis striata]